MKNKTHNDRVRDARTSDTFRRTTFVVQGNTPNYEVPDDVTQQSGYKDMSDSGHITETNETDETREW